MPVTRYEEGVTGFSSTFIFRNVILSPCAVAISSRIGATCLHGPHHSAQKSTRTGLSDLRTWASNSASVTDSMCPTMGHLSQEWSTRSGSTSMKPDSVNRRLRPNVPARAEGSEERLGVGPRLGVGGVADVRE